MIDPTTLDRAHRPRRQEAPALGGGPPPPNFAGKTVWGPAAWGWLHRAAINYPTQPRPETRAGMKARFWAFLHSLPCPECREHSLAYARTHPPDFSGSHAFQIWSWEFHNSVNARLGKPLMGAEEYNQHYAEELQQAYWPYLH